jgi:hypothetical protein
MKIRDSKFEIKKANWFYHSSFVIRIFLLMPFAAIAAETNDLPALVPAYGEIPPTFWQQHKVAIIVGGFLFILAQSFVLWKFLMRLQPKVEPVENLTRAALIDLLNEPEDGKLLSDVSRIIRGYFGKQFQMVGEEATTAEFVAALVRNEKIPAELGDKVSSFLRECDARKFSPAKAAPELDAVERALDLVNEAEKLRTKQDSVSA